MTLHVRKQYLDLVHRVHSNDLGRLLSDQQPQEKEKPN